MSIALLQHWKPLQITSHRTPSCQSLFGYMEALLNGETEAVSAVSVSFWGGPFEQGYVKEIDGQHLAEYSTEIGMPVVAVAIIYRLVH